MGGRRRRRLERTDGPWFKKWIEWRASVIHGFFARTREELKAVKPGLKFGAYTGAWYPSYFEVGVNWASREYDPSQEYAWATPEYRNYGYAELLDIYTNGNYYWNVTIDEYRSSNGLHRNETDSEVSKGDHLCVEGGCRYSRRLLHGKPFYGGMYVEDYKRDTTQFKRAVEMNLRESDGLMVFDIVHIIDRDWWGPLQRAVEAYETGGGGTMRLSALAVLALLCAGSVPAREESGELPAASPEIRYVGRTETTGGSVSFDWSGTYFECRFTGGSLAVRVSDTKRNYYNLTLDGHDAGIVATFGTDSLVVLTEGLGEGEHTLRMQKRTEGEQGRTTLHAFRLARNGRLLPAPPSPGRHIEFIGNSLTCGYGTEGRSKDEPFEPETENCDKAFGCIVARYFGADYTLIATRRRAARTTRPTTSRTTYVRRRTLRRTYDVVPSFRSPVRYVPSSVRTDVTYVRT